MSNVDVLVVMSWVGFVAWFVLFIGGVWATLVVTNKVDDHYDGRKTFVVAACGTIFVWIYGSSLFLCWLYFLTLFK